MQNVYGPAGAWCWIKVGGDNCTTDSGLPYQIGLYYGPFLLLSALSIVEVLYVTGKHTAIKEVVPIFIFPTIVFLTFVFGLAHRISSALLLREGKSPLEQYFIMKVPPLSVSCTTHILRHLLITTPCMSCTCNLIHVSTCTFSVTNLVHNVPC